MKQRAATLLILCLLSPAVTKAADPGPEDFGAPELVKDLGPESTEAWDFRPLGDIVVFRARQDTTTIWRTDGTAAGTYPLQADDDLHTYADSDDGRNLYYFRRDSAENPYELWRTDGTVAGTLALTYGMGFGKFFDPILWPWSAAVRETGLYFFAADLIGSGYDYELWATDGTREGTRLVKDIRPGQPSSLPSQLTSFGGKVIFTARLSETFGDEELWSSDGTAAGTKRLKDLYPGPDNIRFVRRMRDGSVGLGLIVIAGTWDQLGIWRSDGTEKGTVLVKDIGVVGYVHYAINVGRRVFFTVSRDANWPTELWATDGTAAGTVQVLSQIPPGNDSQWYLYLYPVGDLLSFRLSDPEHGFEPWISDGTVAGTGRIGDICPGPCNSEAGILAPIPGTSRGVLRATDGASEGVQWLVDLKPNGNPRRLSDLCPGCGISWSSGLPIGGWLIHAATGPQGQELWASTNGLPDTAFPITDFAEESWLLSRLSIPAQPDRAFFLHKVEGENAKLYSLKVPTRETPPVDPDPPAGEWLTSAAVPGFRFKVRIAGATEGKREAACIGETLCVSGALPGRSEVFLRVVGPKPNGRLWPTLVKFSTSQVEVWVEPTVAGASDGIHYYQLAGSGQGSTLPGVVDRDGFPPTATPAEAAETDLLATDAITAITAIAADPEPPAGAWITSASMPGFRVKARLTAGSEVRGVRAEPCIGETLCLSGALPGRPELFVRVVGPKPNGYLWPTLVRFTTSTAEVWIEQLRTGTVRYYRMEAPSRDSEQLDGFFDRTGFLP